MPLTQKKGNFQEKKKLKIRKRKISYAQMDLKPNPDPTHRPKLQARRVEKWLCVCVFLRSRNSWNRDLPMSAKDG